MLKRSNITMLRNIHDWIVAESSDYFNLGFYEKAQSIFEAGLKENGKVVYGSYDDEKVIKVFGEIQTQGDTHTALLICIQEIEKKCEHKKVKIKEALIIGEYGFECCDCGKKLKANWSVAE